MSKIEDRVAKQLLDRAKVGEAKYGTTMERNDLSLMEWFQHLQEELLDAAVYVEKLKQEVQYQEYVLDINKRDEGLVFNEEPVEHGPCSAHDKQMQEDEDHPEHFDMPFPEDWDEFLEEEAREKRMNIIGQNGNTGEHYDNTGEGVCVAVDKSQPCGWDNTNVPTYTRTATRTIYPGDATITTYNYDKETE